jgi:hypothetical protein
LAPAEAVADHAQRLVYGAWSLGKLTSTRADTGSRDYVFIRHDVVRFLLLSVFCSVFLNYQGSPCSRAALLPSRATNDLNDLFVILLGGHGHGELQVSLLSWRCWSPNPMRHAAALRGPRFEQGTKHLYATYFGSKL